MDKIIIKAANLNNAWTSPINTSNAERKCNALKKAETELDVSIGASTHGNASAPARTETMRPSDSDVSGMADSAFVADDEGSGVLLRDLLDIFKHSNAVDKLNLL